MLLEQAKPNDDNINFLYDCFTSPEIRGDFQPVRNIGREKVIEEIKFQQELSKQIFIIKEEVSMLGYAYVSKSNMFHHYEIGVTIIPSAHYRGVGTFVHSLLIKHVLMNYKAHRLLAYVSESNMAERAILSKFLFKHEGTMRQAGLIGDKFHDIIIYGALKHELERRKYDCNMLKRSCRCR